MSLIPHISESELEAMRRTGGQVHCPPVLADNAQPCTHKDNVQLVC